MDPKMMNLSWHWETSKDCVSNLDRPAQKQPRTKIHPFLLPNLPKGHKPGLFQKTIQFPCCCPRLNQAGFGCQADETRIQTHLSVKIGLSPLTLAILCLSLKINIKIYY